VLTLRVEGEEKWTSRGRTKLGGSKKEKERDRSLDPKR
jgi:hypothetical protein